ncbi:MAG TPA: carbamoyltransferase HypF, partial [Terriglobales bacterium]|nr:carbamoyltransferase HypF [Terriglobales bacterium]
MPGDAAHITDVQVLRRLRAAVRGAVQGVGFRPFVYRLAAELGLNGWVVNSAQGVLVEVEGDEASLRRFLVRLERDKPAIAFIQSLESAFLDPAGLRGFEIRESQGGEKTALVLPDIATCPACLGEIHDPADRRYRYPFTNCTHCGPRFTIIESLPYDRPRTTMKKFTMCERCAAEYHDPANRRFHAQPNACPDCGPQLELWDAGGAALAQKHDALSAAALAVRDGRIVAVKGLGGFHLLVDARNEDAVAGLRRRKAREEKPFALMYPSAEMALRDCAVSEVEERLLRSPESPIVLLRRRDWGGDELAASIAPRNPYLGVMLPYTPLHHLLMDDLGFPVVATSGNRSDEPICTDEREAVERLRGIADVFLVHNRPILRHVDDSIVREMAGREMVLRRARGFAPLPVQVERDLPPLLAVGAHQKNTIATAVGRQVFVSQHIGDL